MKGSGTLGFGAVLHWEKFEFPDGGEAKNKYLVVVGANEGMDYLLVIANTKRRNDLKEGCNAEKNYFVVRGGGKNFFSVDTMIHLYRPPRANRAQLLQLAFAKEVDVRGNLSPELAAAIRNCIKRTDDISDDDLALLS